MTHTEYNLTEKEFYRLLEDLKAGNIKDTELEIDTEYLYEGTRYRIGDKETVLLCEALKKNSHIKKVTLHNQHIADIGAKALAEVNSIEELMLPYNKIGPEGATALAKSNLKVLDLYVNSLVSYREDPSNEDEIGELRFHEEAEIEKMMQAFTNNKTIFNLDLSTSEISDEFIARLISNNTTIVSLSFQDNSASDKILRYIGNNKTISELFISRNEITDAGTKYLIENNTLKTLSLYGNKITDAGAKILSSHSTLKHLNLIKNQLTIKGMKCFLNSKLDTIKVSFNTGATQEEIFKFENEFKQMLRSRTEVSQIIESEIHEHDLAGDINNPDI